MVKLPFFERIETALSIAVHVGNLWILRGQGHLVPEKERTLEYMGTHDFVFWGYRVRISAHRQFILTFFFDRGHPVVLILTIVYI